MVDRGFTITRAIQSRAWPAASANLEYAAVWGTFADVSEQVQRVAEGVLVSRISTLLEPAGRVDGNPVALDENAGIAFQGCIVLGMGFVLEPQEAQEWIATDAHNAEVLFPYLNGEDLNGRPDHSASRWAIDFNDRTEEDAAAFVLPFRRLVEAVKPERQRLKADGSYALRRPLPERWWQYGEKRPAMRRAIADLSEVLVLAQVSNTAQPVLIPKGIVPSHKLVVFASDSRALFACLASSIHYVWARKYSGAMKNDLSYSPSDVFLTFPRPIPTDRLEQSGSLLDEQRSEIMLRRELGLTQVYNLVNDSDVIDDDDVNRLREIHVEVDEAVAAAYGWEDLSLGHGFHSYRQTERWTISAAARIEIVDRLIEENLRRSQVERSTADVSQDSQTFEGEHTLFE